MREKAHQARTLQDSHYGFGDHFIFVVRDCVAIGGVGVAVVSERRHCIESIWVCLVVNDVVDDVVDDVESVGEQQRGFANFCTRTDVVFFKMASKFHLSVNHFTP
jgi:hypothetical protein